MNQTKFDIISEGYKDDKNQYKTTSGSTYVPLKEEKLNSTNNSLNNMDKNSDAKQLYFKTSADFSNGKQDMYLKTIYQSDIDEIAPSLVAECGKQKECFIPTDAMYEPKYENDDYFISQNRQYGRTVDDASIREHCKRLDPSMKTWSQIYLSGEGHVEPSQVRRE